MLFYGSGAIRVRRGNYAPHEYFISADGRTTYYYSSSWPGADVAGVRSAGTRLRAGRGAVALVVSGSRAKRRPKRETATQSSVERKKPKEKRLSLKTKKSRREI